MAEIASLEGTEQRELHRSEVGVTVVRTVGFYEGGRFVRAVTALLIPFTYGERLIPDSIAKSEQQAVLQFLDMEHAARNLREDDIEAHVFEVLYRRARQREAEDDLLCCDECGC